MLVLALDTSFQAGGAALARDGLVLARRRLSPGEPHSRQVLPALDGLLADAGAAMADLGGLAVSLGPGFFTGLRVGLATAQGLGLALGLPAVGFSSLRLLAAGAGGQGLVWAVADARRGLTYAAAFRAGPHGGLTRLTEDLAITPERLAPLLEPPGLLVGAGARLYADQLLPSGLTLADDALDEPDPGQLALLGQRRLTQGQGGTAADLRPRYCRPSDAEVRFGLPLDEYSLVE